MQGLKPFWNYYGGKFRAAPRYPAPQHPTIIEPFAGAAGYSLKYFDRSIVLVEKYPVVAAIWSYLIKVSPEEIRRIPFVESVDELPYWVPQEARYLVGFTMNDATVSPCKVLSSGRRKLRDAGRVYQGWSDLRKERIASQVTSIRHWKIIEGDYTLAPDIEAVWFIDPPYNNRAGSYYPNKVPNYINLGFYCMTRLGQTLVCENEGADWLPFRPFAVFKAGINGSGSKEVLWEQHT